MSGWNVEQRKFLINIDYCLLGNLVCLGGYIISPIEFQYHRKENLKMLILAVVENSAFSPGKLQFFPRFSP